MIAGDDQFVTEGLLSQPGVEVVYFIRRRSIHHEVSRVNQDVAAWKSQPAMEAVRIADADQPQQTFSYFVLVGGFNPVPHRWPVS